MLAVVRSRADTGDDRQFLVAPIARDCFGTLDEAAAREAFREAGYRYAVDADDPDVLRAEFTPTTPFCPQSHTLTIGSFRAWNGLSDRHDYDLVRVRVADMHQRSSAINDELEALETEYRETGELPDPDDEVAGSPDESPATTDRPDPGDAPF